MSEVGWSSWEYKRNKICLQLITVEVGWWHSGGQYTIPPPPLLYRPEVFKKLLCQEG